MKYQPLVSVLMAAYNIEKYVQEAVESVLKQSYENFELIIVDDCSSDSTFKILEKLSKKDKRIKLYRNEKNLGRPKTRNKLLDLVSSNSKYFMWMDSDDVIREDLIVKKVSYFENHPSVDVLGSSIEYVDENLNFIKRRKYPVYHNDIKKNAMISSPVSQGGIMIKSDGFQEKYDLSYQVCQDYEMWLRLLDKGYVFHNLVESFYLYRQFPGQGKQKNLKLTLWNTICIKTKHIFKQRNISFKALFRYCAEIVLFCLPKSFVLWLFYRVK